MGLTTWRGVDYMGGVHYMEGGTCIAAPGTVNRPEQQILRRVHHADVPAPADSAWQVVVLKIKPPADEEARQVGRVCVCMRATAIESSMVMVRKLIASGVLSAPLSLLMVQEDP
eukprot:9484217-Pyramimonas_sp.AAC.1